MLFLRENGDVVAACAPVEIAPASDRPSHGVATGCSHGRQPMEREFNPRS